jgi:hypothetical protein
MSTLHHCYGRDFPRIPRGESIGCLDNNWPANWRWLDGPDFPAPWDDILTEGLTFEETTGESGFVTNRWLWEKGNFERTARLRIFNEQPDQSIMKAELTISDAPLGGGIFTSLGFAWGNRSTLFLLYTSGASNHWTAVGTPITLGRGQYEDLPPDFCESLE